MLTLPATHEGPLRLGDWEIRSYVLKGGQRVIAQRGFMGAFQLKGRGSGNGHRLANILREHIAIPLIYKEVLMDIENPVRFRTLKGVLAYGYEADILVKYCEVFLKARERKALRTQIGFRYAIVAESLVRAAAKVGIVALVDEATGYQAVRARDELQKLLGRYIRADLAEWVKTFPDEYYEELGRLKGWGDLLTGKRPGVIGHITNEIVYARLAPGIVKELRRRNPWVPEKGRLHKHHQHLTDDVGYPELRAHLDRIVFLMRASTTWSSFERALDRAAPKFGDTLPLLLVDREGEPV